MKTWEEVRRKGRARARARERSTDPNESRETDSANTGLLEAFSEQESALVFLVRHEKERSCEDANSVLSLHYRRLESGDPGQTGLIIID